MKIVVVGLGETGRALIYQLEGKGHDITVIDKDKSCVDRITDKYTVNGVCGSGASVETLSKAGAVTADLLVALTHTDEINLVACMQAKSIGCKSCAARILMPDLVEESESIKKTYNLDYLLCPKVDLAEDIYLNLGLPGNVKLEKLDEDTYGLDLNVIKSTPFIGWRVSDIRENLCPELEIVSITRGKRNIPPKDNATVEICDGIYVRIGGDRLDKTLEALGVIRSVSGDVILVGAGITGAYLAAKLMENKRKLTIIDNDLNRCRELMELYPDARVEYASGDITETLEDEHVEKSGAIISLTDNDETNLVISMFAWSKGIPSVITRVDKQVHVKLLHQVNIDITVSPTELTVFKILRIIGE